MLCKRHAYAAKRRFGTAINVTVEQLGEIGVAPFRNAVGCAVPGCAERGNRRSGLCERHVAIARNRYRTIWDLSREQLAALAVIRPLRFGVRRGCLVPGCAAIHEARGLCHEHYKKAWVRGWIGKELSRDELTLLAEARWVNRYKTCRVPGCGGRGIHEICARHRARAIGRGLDYKRLSSEQLAALSIIVSRRRAPPLPCRVPGCNESGIRNLCKVHTTRARGRGLDLEALTPEQITDLARLLRERVPHGPCRVPGCKLAGPRSLCRRHTTHARYRGFDLLRLSAEQLSILAALVPRPRVPAKPCRVPGCVRSTASAICHLHRARARSRGLNPKRLSPEQLAGLAKFLVARVPLGPCRVPGCGLFGPGNLCPPHTAQARRRELDLSALTAKLLASLAEPDRTRASQPPCRVPGCMYFGPSGLCQMHRARARAKGFDAASITRKQLASLVRWW